ncbi:type VI secretion system tip protein VgrG [Schlegelella sp. S2-27]|uniref:Type VI secretion system tip protein VgrG n=1 Tax=Caldimonas mangrovi TaxID=2944811 RepID=A0ABT0YRF9_9BURK|nr:type VI secretion system tip protein VgrG [Caldimonas mangrovi]MCM5680914.1 type VI secretion system tip protein VgrG [Caldimonas mangrovi]
MARVMEISTPLGDDVLLFRSMSANEELGRLFEYRIEVLSERDDVDPDDVLGKNVTVKLELPEGDPRAFDGFVTRFASAGVVGRYHRYLITARPWLWLLTRASDCRIFQQKSVPDIIKEIFDKYPVAAFENRLTGSYGPQEYCVQYRETDFNFVSRLMEQEGIYYFFEHEDGKHTLVLADGPSAHTPYDGYASLPFVPHDRGGRLEQEYVAEWSFSREIQPGAYVLDDFDFTKPSTELRVTTKRERQHAEAAHEVYDYPGRYEQSGDGEHYVRTRLEEQQARHELVHAAGNARGVAAGSLLKLTGHTRADQNREYLIVSTHIVLEYTEYEAMESSGSRFHCSFGALPSAEVFRSERLTRKPFVQGPQTAIVVGPGGDEIYTDKYGRVKVQFHWDRLGAQDENSSCWVRVSQPWAGKNFGMIAIPRIGQEVVVDFLEGDPDRPMITGRVYNAEQMPPWELPGNMTRTGIVTRSSKGGSASNANELRFEDKKGEEEVFLHAERNLRTTVEVDELRDVGNDRTTDIHGIDRLTVDKSRYEHVKGDFRDLLIDNLSLRRIGAGEIEEITDGLQTTIKTGGHQHTVSSGGQTINITGGIEETVTGAVTQNVNGGDYSQTVSTGSSTQTISVGSWTVNATAGLEMITTQKLNITAPMGVFLLGGTKLNGYATEESWFSAFKYGVTGMSTESKGVNMETKGVDIGSVGFKGESVAFKNSEAALNKVANVLQIANPVTLIAQGAIALHKKAMTIIG